MRLTRSALTVGWLTSAAVVAGGTQSSPVNRPWPPGVQKVGPRSPVLPADRALETFYMPPGYRLELVASEPMVQEPVAVDWDVQGRLWVVEMPGFMADLTGSNEHDPIGRVVVLEDANGDGRMDTRTVFADGLVLARSVKVLDRGVLVGEPPNAWLMRDTDGDLRADARELVTDQYGRRDVDPQNNANGFGWALDNVMHTAGQSDVQMRLVDGRFEVQRTLRRGEWGVTHDDVGRVYRNTNESALHVDLVPTAYYARNPNLVRTRGSYERLANDAEDLNVVWPVRPNPGTNRAYQFGIDRPDGSLAKFTAVCAPLVYRGDRLPPDLYGNVFVAEPAANLVSRLVLDDSGPTLRARKAYPEGEFLASTDERFRPVYLSNAPDGTLYVVDMYRGIIEHRISLTVYLRDQILERGLQGPTGLGRIYRVVHESTRRDAKRMQARAPTADLVADLSHPNGWWRDTAQRRLVERADRSAAPALVKLARAGDVKTQLHALWTLDGFGALEPREVAAALRNPSRDVRVSAVRLAERWVAEQPHPGVLAALLERLEDADAAVQRQLAASLGSLPAGPREDALTSLLDRAADDPVVLDAALSSLRGAEATILARLAHRERTTAREAATAMLAATIVRGGQDAAIQELFASIAAGPTSAWQRAARLQGAEIALLGAAPAGSGRRGAPPIGPGAPCATCPGGRAGPGGAYAYPRPHDSAAFTALAGAARGRGPVLRLTREPSALVAFGESHEELRTRVTSLLERVSWPGKAGDAAPVPALAPEEQQRFDAGREVYRNLCQACHQPDGRGQDRIAPSLVGSALALAPSGIPVRILLHGKEGRTGLMPPIGAAITDAQIASVLTYIRREWGQTGSPVNEEAVRSVRSRTADRSRPWTDAELAAVVNEQR
jgi:mono/diheme cytochrome c family protein/glucose/arabinose dehydrogenase